MIKLSTILFGLFVSLLVASFLSGFSPVLGLADEMLLLLSVAVLLSSPILNGTVSKFTLILIVYVAYSFINSAISPFSPNLLYAFLQSLIHAKLFIVSFAAIKLYQSAAVGGLIVKRLFSVFLVLFAVGFILNYILGERWNYFFTNEAVQYRYGFIRPSGIFGHYAPNGYFFSLILVTLFMLRTKTLVIDKKSQIRKFYILVLVDFLAAFPLTVRKGLFMIIPYGFYILTLLSPVRRALFAITASLFLIIFTTAVSKTTMFEDTVSNITQFFSDDHAYLRGLIVFHGFSLFAEFFPFGVGNGLYGTYFSNTNYSVYEYVGLNPAIFIRDNGALSAIYDSGIAAIVAEIGFIGCLLYAMLIVSYIRFNRRLLDTHNFRIFKILTTFAIILSITEPVWQNGFFTTFFTVCILYIYTKNNLYRVNGTWTGCPTNSKNKV